MCFDMPEHPNDDSKPQPKQVEPQPDTRSADAATVKAQADAATAKVQADAATTKAQADAATRKEELARHTQRKLDIGLASVFVILLIVVCLVSFHFSNGGSCFWRLAIAIVLAVGVCAFSYTRLFGAAAEQEGSTAADGATKYAISFLVVTFICLGSALVVGATNLWPVALLWAGSALLSGGFLGLLFGVSYNPAPVQSPNQPAGQALTQQQQVTHHAHTLMQESASWLSKIFTGAVLVKFHTFEDEFKRVADSIGKYLAPNAADSVCCHLASQGVGVLGGAVLAYFALTGFIAGLLLPSYFMRKFLDGDSGGSDVVPANQSTMS